MSPRLRKILDISVKQAVLALITNGLVMAQWHDIFNFNNWAGVWAVVRLTGTVVGAAEFATWAPIAKKWAATNANPEDVLKDKIDVAENKAQDAVAAVHDVKDAAAELPPKP